MNITRRQFLKLTGAVAATLAIVELGFDEKTVKAKSGELKISKIKADTDHLSLLFSRMRHPRICDGR